MEIKLDEELSKIEREESMQSLLENITSGKNICTMDYPNFGKINVEIIGVNLKWIYHRSVHVEILDKGLVKEETHYRDAQYWGMGFEPEQESYTVKVPVKEEWVNVEWLSNYRESNNA